MARLTIYSTNTPYITILNNVGKWWNGTVFEDFDVLNWVLYSNFATRYSTSSIWYLGFPPTIPEGYVDIVQFRRTGTDPVVDDIAEASGSFYWDGSILAAAVAMDEIVAAIGELEIDTAPIVDAIRKLELRPTRTVLGPCKKKVRSICP